MICADSRQIICYYTNVTSQIQIARITNTPSNSFEQIIFPGQRLLFETVPKAELEIFIGITGKETFLDRITCKYLCVGS